MSRVLLTVTESRCRGGYCKAGDAYEVGDLCPPICAELWHCVYPYVFALRNGALLDCGEEKVRFFTAECPDGGRVKVRGELIDD